ncbi:galactitol-specific phosphotransferase system IIB component [Sphingobium sp. B1D7B]|uniref:hypothetical protein n=1 Tax=Sphingobium sp. B1D7B TaxID=2940578 RepID=UPI002224F1CC|nr:hypothetical protein [Sphingobium sp. B1D7B]MCW2405086.1 galactitol-specific phosphotransferase system IIB component [Sphingobium sp. B1D7B]
MPNPLTITMLAEALKQAMLDDGGDAWMDKMDSADAFRIDGPVDLHVTIKNLLRTIEEAGWKVVPAEPVLPEYDHWLPNVWDAYLRDLVGWEHKDKWARLPATFRWHEFHTYLAQAIEARRAETQRGSVHESAVATPCAQGLSSSPHIEER